MLRDELVAGGVDVILLDTWYKKDSNAVPPVSVLQPISSILINFNNKVRVKSFAEQKECVMLVEKKKIIILNIIKQKSLKSVYN